MIRRGALLDGRIADIRVSEQVLEVAPALARLPDEQVLEARQGAVLPGLHDHHLHVRAAAAALDSLHVGPPAVGPSSSWLLHFPALYQAPTGGSGRSGITIRWPGSWTGHGLTCNAACSGASAASQRCAVDAQLRGIGPHRVRRSSRRSAAQRGWRLVRRIAAPGGRPFQLSQRLARYGVTGVTDATPDLDG